MSAAETATHHLYPLISDLGLILMTAAVAVLLFKKIKQPLVLGYLIAGFLAGNHFDFFPSVKDVHSVEVWAEIGVIFLLFSLGLEFSFKKLMKVGGTASITAGTQIFTMLGIGYVTGMLMGWKTMDCIFLAVILSISSTTIIVKAFTELGVKTQHFTSTVIGSLIVQDILAILMMVLLSTIAVTQQFSGQEMIYSILKLLFFLTLWFVCGIFFIPTLLKRAKKLITDEMLLIISLALCLMMVIFASRVGFSPALGAFIMGSIIAETTQAEHIEHLVRPVKDLFGAVFFVSVGMLINPNTLVEYWVPVLILTVITIFGQSISSTIGSLISGQPLKQSIQTGMSLSQIGEFSFIIATLGMTLNVTSSFLYPVVVAVSAITTFTTPFMIKFSAPFSDYLVKKLPRKWTKRIERYSANAQSIKSASNWQIVLRAYITQVVIHSVIIIAITLLSTRYFLPLVITTNHGNELAAVITLVVLAPFLWALSLRRVVLLRFILALVYIGFLLDNFFSPQVALITLVIAALLYLLFPKKLNAQYSKIESRFFKNLNERESVKNKRQLSGLTPWDGHMTYFDISKESNIAGKTLEELSIREQMGINIAFIKRGEITITVPSRNERLFPGDEICVIGTDIQLKEFKKYLDENEIAKPEEIAEPEIVMRQFELVDEEFMGKSIRQSGLREKTSGLVVGLERRGKRIMNPDSHLVLQKDDILWIVGDRKLLTRLIRSQHS